MRAVINDARLIPRRKLNGAMTPGGVPGSIFAGYVPPASQNPYLIIVYSVAKL